MITKVILVRHGETDWNVKCRFLGRTDRFLTEKGCRQAGYAQKALTNEHIDVVYSSPLSRAYTTGEIILGNRNLSIHKEDGLMEMNWGTWEGLTGDEVEAKYPGQIYLWGNHPEQIVVENGESFEELQKRMVDTFWKIVKENRGKTILITSHMIALTMLLLYFDHREFSDLWNVKPVGNGALNILEVLEGDEVVITAWSDDTFVPEEEKKGNVLVAGRCDAQK